MRQYINIKHLNHCLVHSKWEVHNKLQLSFPLRADITGKDKLK